MFHVDKVLVRPTTLVSSSLKERVVVCYYNDLLANVGTR